MNNKQLMMDEVLLCMQNALLGAVVPSLRAVVVDVDEECKILFYSFFYDCEVTDELFDLASVACVEASSHFPKYTIEETIELHVFPKPIEAKGIYAYLRKE